MFGHDSRIVGNSHLNSFQEHYLHRRDKAKETILIKPNNNVFVTNKRPVLSGSVSFPHTRVTVK